MIFKNFFDFLSGEADVLLKKSQSVLISERKFVMRELDFEDDPLPISGYAVVDDDDQPLEPPLLSS